MDRSAVIDRWKSEEAAVRAKRAAPGVASPEELKACSGIEFLRRIIDGTLPPAPISETLDFALVMAEPGRAIFQGTPDRRHYNPLGSVHGGWFATSLRKACSCRSGARHWAWALRSGSSRRSSRWRRQIRRGSIRSG